MWRWNPAPTWSASCSFRPSPRNLGLEAARALGERVKGRAGKVALTVDASDETLADIVEALKPDMLQLHGSETPERVAAVRKRFGLPVMKALPIAERNDLAPIRLYANVADRLIFDARAPQDATRPGGLGTAVRLDAAQGHRSGNSVHAVGRARRRQCRRGDAHHARAGRRCVVRRRTRARRKGPGQDPRLHPRRARRRSRACRRSAHDRAAAQFVPHRPRRARPFRHLWRPLCRRDADAADSRTGKGLCRGQGRSEIPEGNGRPSRELCRPAVAAVFRRAADAEIWRRQDLLQARGAQPHRRAQGEQRARPDHAGAAHGQEAHHRRDRRRHAWRRHRHAVRQVRSALHRLHGRGRRRAAEAERVADEDPRAPRFAPSNRAPRRSKTP